MSPYEVVQTTSLQDVSTRSLQQPLFFDKKLKTTLFYNIIPAFNRSVRHTAILSLTLTASLCLFQSCFTGIESTKTVSLSREDRKILQPTPEETYFKGVKSEPLSMWKKGKSFIAADNKALLIFDQQGMPTDPENANLGGTILKFEEILPKYELDGTTTASIIFSANGKMFKYNTGKPMAAAQEQIMSDQIPMLIDLDMVKSAKDLLKGNKLWIRSHLWYDESGKRIPGRKFVEVTIDDVEPGDISFPLKIKFTDNKGTHACIFMSYGNSGIETRLFSNLFFISDLREKYPAISDETWNAICEGNVKTGMTKEECKLSLGNPDDVNRGHDYSQTLDLWLYSNGTALWFEDGILTRFRK